MADDPPINLRRLRKRGRMPQAGDVFALGLPDGDYLFGRVLAGPLDRDAAPMPGSFLVYVYRHWSPDAVPNYDELRPDCLLIPPTFMNQLGFTKGYLDVVDNRPVGDGDLLANHCFRRWTGDYLDERGRPRKAPTEPCGEWASATTGRSTTK